MPVSIIILDRCRGCKTSRQFTFLFRVRVAAFGVVSWLVRPVHTPAFDLKGRWENRIHALHIYSSSYSHATRLNVWGMYHILWWRTVWGCMNWHVLHSYICMWIDAYFWIGSPACEKWSGRKLTLYVIRTHRNHLVCIWVTQLLLTPNVQVYVRI